MRPGIQRALRTRVYIDGYNLYYGCLKNTAHKWLDLRALAERILLNVPYSQDGVPVIYEFRPPAIKYFTASILKSFARAEDSVVCQAEYHSALRGHLGADLQIIRGHYDARPARAHAWVEGRAARECETLEIWKLEEKQSDVALALHSFSDAVRNEVDQVIAITNDSDFAPAMAHIRQHTKAVIGLISPVREGTSKFNRELEKHADWTRSHVLNEELAASQLPPMVRIGHSAVHKPLSWYPRPDLLLPIYEEARRVRGSNGAARKWLNQPCEPLGNRVPIEMCTSRETADELLAYMVKYSEECCV